MTKTCHTASRSALSRDPGQTRTTAPRPGDGLFMYRESAGHSASSGDNWATARVIHQATGFLMVRRRTSTTDADAYLFACAQVMGVNRGALSRLIIDAVNARGAGSR